jgi:hypothetical protein
MIWTLVEVTYADPAEHPSQYAVETGNRGLAVRLAMRGTPTGLMPQVASVTTTPKDEPYEHSEGLPRVRVPKHLAE